MPCGLPLPALPHPGDRIQRHLTALIGRADCPLCGMLVL
jgi:hypothetical protein